MSLCRRLTAASLLAAAALCPAPACAFDLNGAWATDVSYCEKVFKKQGNRVTFTQLSELYGGGFIIEGNRVQVQLGHCTIESRKEDGKTIHVRAACTTQIATEQVELDINVVDDNTFSRTFPGTSAAVDYHRCTL